MPEPVEPPQTVSAGGGDVQDGVWDAALAVGRAAAENWALLYPIPAWGLATGADAEKVARIWGAQVADRVLVAAAPLIAAQVLRDTADAIEAYYPPDVFIPGSKATPDGIAADGVRVACRQMRYRADEWAAAGDG